MCLDSKCKHHVTHQGSESRSLHVICTEVIPWPGLYYSSSEGEQRQRFPWQLYHMLDKEPGMSLLLPLVACMEKMQGMKHHPMQEQTALGIPFQTADGSQFAFGEASRFWGIYVFFLKWPRRAGILEGFLVFPTSSRAKYTWGWPLSWYLNPTSSNPAVKNKAKTFLEMWG